MIFLFLWSLNTWEKDIITVAIAIYGSLVSSIGLGWHIDNIIRDRPKIKIKYRKNMRVVGLYNITYPYKPNIDYFAITVINRGRRPLTITKVALMLKKAPHLIITESLFGGRELKEGKSTDYLVEQDLIDFSKLVYILIYDATDKVYKKRYRE